MAKYLNPCSDVVFKKIFGEHPNLLISFLNSILPLPSDGLIEFIEYLPTEHVPRIPEFKHTIVDVKCTDQGKRVFIVEVQIAWHTSFRQRMLFNASNAYIKQLKKGETYSFLRPVYGLAILGDNFDSGPDWYHHYQMVNVKDTNKTIEDLQLIFLELPKFKATTLVEKKLKILWLRFIAQINEDTTQVAPELMENEDIRQALELAEVSAYTQEELAYYDSYQDALRREKTLIVESEAKGEARGEARGEAKNAREIAKKMLRRGRPLKEIAEDTGLSEAEIRDLSS